MSDVKDVFRLFRETVVEKKEKMAQKQRVQIILLRKISNI